MARITSGLCALQAALKKTGAFDKTLIVFSAVGGRATKEMTCRWIRQRLHHLFSSASRAGQRRPDRRLLRREQLPAPRDEVHRL